MVKLKTRLATPCVNSITPYALSQPHQPAKSFHQQTSTATPFQTPATSYHFPQPKPKTNRSRIIPRRREAEATVAENAAVVEVFRERSCLSFHTTITTPRPRVNTDNEVQPERRFHQVLHTSDANSTCEKGLESFEEMKQKIPDKYGNVLVIRAYTLETELAIISKRDNHHKHCDLTKVSRPARQSEAPQSNATSATT
ncbi:hypothetical protein VTL71DRAFT_11892 [Oculimacula yallundae]|uniref:Uncharacterized protein n=1 Tax=Oculimacula yallundae TaxID=86028 RepID=A0ABR4CRE8_9HELO